MPALVLGWRCQRHSRRTLASVQRPHVLIHWPSMCVSPAWCCRAKSGRVQQSRGTDDTRPQVPHCHTGLCRCRGYLSWYMNSWPHIALSPLHASPAEWPNGLTGDLLLFLALRQLPSVDQGRRQHPSALMPHWGSCRKIDRFAGPFFSTTTVPGPPGSFSFRRLLLIGVPPPVAIGRALQPFPRSKPDRRVSPHPASLGRWFMTVLTGSPFCLTAQCPVQRPLGLHLTATLIRKFAHVLVPRPWLAFTMSRALHPGIGLLRSLCPPSHTLAFSRPVARQSGFGVPQFQDIRRLEIPVAACCAPGALGTTYRNSGFSCTPHHTFWFRCLSHFHLFPITTRSTQVSLVSRGIRSGRSTLAWLRVAELLSLGFPPPQVPPVDAGQGDLTPLFMCNPLNGLSIYPVKGRTPETGEGWGGGEAVGRQHTPLLSPHPSLPPHWGEGVKAS